MNRKIITLIIGLILTSIVITGIVLISNSHETDTSNQITNEDYQNNENILNNNDTEIKKEYLDGFEIAGNINIPKTNIDIPVLTESTVSSLNTSVAIVYGSGLNNIGNTVIYGNTYYQENKDKFFSNNNKLVLGDIFYITTQSNNRITYEIYDIKNLKASDVSYYERDTQGKREVTLVTTSNDSTYSRLVIFAREI